MKLPEESRLNLTPTMIVSAVAFQNLIQTLKEERPKAVQWAKVAYTFWRVHRIVVIGLDDFWTV